MLSTLLTSSENKACRSIYHSCRNLGIARRTSGWVLPAKDADGRPLIVYSDNRSVVEAVHSTKLVDDKRLILDIGAVRQMLKLGEVQAVEWCPGASQLADCMAKKGASAYRLLTVLQSGKVVKD